MIWDTVEFWGPLYFQNLQKSAGPRELFGPQTSILWRITCGALRKDWRTDPRTVLSVSTIQKTPMLSKFQSFIIYCIYIYMICIYVIKYIYIILYWILHISPSKMFDITIHISTFLVGSIHPSTGSPSTDPLGAAPPPENTPHRCRRNSAATGRRPSAKSGGLRSEKPFTPWDSKNPAIRLKYIPPLD